MEIVGQTKISMPDAIKSNLKLESDKSKPDSRLLTELFSSEKFLLKDALTPFIPLTVVLRPKEEVFDFKEFDETGAAQSSNETPTPIILGDEKIVVLHPAQLIAFASDKLNHEKFAEILHQWKKTCSNKDDVYDDKTGMFFKRTFKNPHINITLDIKGVRVTIPAFLAYINKPDDMPDLNSLSLSQGLIELLKTKGVDLYANPQEATIVDFSVPRLPSNTSDYIS